METLLSVFILQLLFRTIRPSVLQITSADLRYVRPGEDITLLCNITAENEISWFHQSSEEMKMKMLLSAERGKVNKQFSLRYNVDKSHFDGTKSSGSISLVIFGVTETDLGLYYCGERGLGPLLQFGNAIRLRFTDFLNSSAQSNTEPSTHSSVSPDSPHTSVFQESVYPSTSPDSSNTSTSPDSAGPAVCWNLDLYLLCVCLVSVLMNIVCLGLFLYRVQEKNCNKPSIGDTTEKDEELHYASIQHRGVGVSTAGIPASTVDFVIYSSVTSRPQGQSPVCGVQNITL